MELQLPHAQENLLKICTEHLLSIGFVVDERDMYGGDPKLKDNPPRFKSESTFHHFLYVDVISGFYEVMLQEYKSLPEDYEILGGLIVRVDRWFITEEGEEPLNSVEVNLISISSLSDLKLLVEGTRTWRSIKLHEGNKAEPPYTEENVRRQRDERRKSIMG